MGPYNHLPHTCSSQFIYFFEDYDILENPFDIGSPYQHYKFFMLWLPVKMAAKNVVKPIQRPAIWRMSIFLEIQAREQKHNHRWYSWYLPITFSLYIYLRPFLTFLFGFYFTFLVNCDDDQPMELCLVTYIAKKTFR